MIPEIDVWRTAHLLIKQHGEDAAVQAAFRADALFAKGDLDGYSVWKRIVAAINDLQSNKPTGSTH